jgi:hypothetical protein
MPDWEICFALSSKRVNGLEQFALNLADERVSGLERGAMLDCEFPTVRNCSHKHEASTPPSGLRWTAGEPSVENHDRLYAYDLRA